jgi:hypothetical protein
MLHERQHVDLRGPVRRKSETAKTYQQNYFEQNYWRLMHWLHIMGMRQRGT